jgi:hypothetical protein
VPVDRERERERIRREVHGRPGPETPIRRAAEANQIGFDHPADAYFVDCPECKSRVALHCVTCKVPITGCSCTLADKIDDEIARIRREQSGLWVPPNAN